LNVRRPASGDVLMKRYSVPALITVSIFGAFWAYLIADTLIRELSKDVTFIYLGSIYILGLISGVTLGLAFMLNKRKQSHIQQP
jgi:uncharacterized membrane protein